MKHLKNIGKTFICLLLMAALLLSGIACSASPATTPAASAAPGANAAPSTAPDASTAPAPASGAPAAPQGTAATAYPHKVIGVTIYFMTEFCVLMVEGMQEEALKQNVELIILDAKNDPALQLSQVENLISQKVDSIIVSPANSEAIVPAIEMCEAAGIPLSAVNMTITTDKPYYYVGPDEVQAGELSAQWLIDNVGENAKICIIQGPIGSSAQIMRDEGIFNILNKHKGVEVLAIKPGDWNRATAVSLTENWIQTYGDKLDAIISHDDDMGLGVVLALQAANMKDKVKVIACADAIEEACVSVAKGDMDVTYFQDVFLEGELSTEMGAKLARGEKVEPMQVLIDMVPTEKAYAQELLDTYYGPRKK